MAPAARRRRACALATALVCGGGRALIVPHPTRVFGRHGVRRAMGTTMWAGQEGQSAAVMPSRPQTNRALADVAASSAEPLKLGVLLLNLGGPERGEDVEPFLFNLFADSDIIRLPSILRWLQKPLASVIAKNRAPKSRSAYASIGGGSPIARWTNAQAAALETRLGAKGVLGARAYVAMRYWHPFTEEALTEMKRDGVNALVVLPLYPHFSISTSGSSLRVLGEAFAEEPARWGPGAGAEVAHTVVPSWHSRPGYVSALARLVAREVAALPAAQRAAGVDVLFSAHGVPKSYVEAGDPYQRQVEECAELVSRRTRALLAANGNVPATEDCATAAAAGSGVEFHLSYQSRVGPVEWLRPYTETKILELAAAGVSATAAAGAATAGNVDVAAAVAAAGAAAPVKSERGLVVVPISFVSEHIETLEEIDIEYREIAEEAGVQHWRRVPALGTDAAFIDDMAEMVVDALMAPALTVPEAFALNNCDRAEPSLLERLLGPSANGAGAAAASGSGNGVGGGIRLGSGGALSAVLANAGDAAGGGNRLAALGTAAFLADGVGREVVCRGLLHLPMH